MPLSDIKKKKLSVPIDCRSKARRRRHPTFLLNAITPAAELGILQKQNQRNLQKNETYHSPQTALPLEDLKAS